MATFLNSLAGVLIALSVSAPGIQAQSTPSNPDSEVAVSVDPSKAGSVIPPDFLGISLEMQSVLPQADGSYVFRHDNKPLVTLFQTLGIHSLRLGGYTADSVQLPLPTPADIDNIFAFAKAAHTKVIFTLRRSDDPTQDAATANYILSHYKNDLTSFGIGNEAIGPTYDQYKELFGNFVSALKPPTFPPDIAFCGPETLPGREDWVRNLADDFGAKGCLNLLSLHAYFGGSGRAVDDPVKGRTDLLSPKLLDQYQTMYDGIAPAVAKTKLPFRLDETNSFFSGGAPDVSNTHASALWGLDYLHWWASHQAAGVNFHNGSKIGDPAEGASCAYAVFWASDAGFHARPLGYAMKAFDLGSHGASVPVRISKPDQLNVTAYAVVAPDKTLYLTLINKGNADPPRPATLRLFINDYEVQDTLALTSDQNDRGSTDTETLGQARIGDDGTWAGKWTPFSGTTLELPPASAVVLRMHPQ